MSDGKEPDALPVKDKRNDKRNDKCKDKLKENSQAKPGRRSTKLENVWDQGREGADLPESR